MTRTTNARIAGFTFLFYIAVGITSLVLFGRATSGEGIAAELAGIARHATDVRVTVVLDLLQCFSALVLGVTLYAITSSGCQCWSSRWCWPLWLLIKGVAAPSAHAEGAGLSGA